MGYILNALLGRQKDLQLIVSTYKNAKLVSVGLEICIIPMIDELYDEINALSMSEDIGSLTCMSKSMEAKLLEIIGNACISYIEATYFGGQGGQSAVIWQNGERRKLYDYGQGAINLVLKHFGIVAVPGLDEFDTISLGRYRDIEDWLD